MSELVIIRQLFVSGPHYDTTVQVENVSPDGDHGPGVTITQSTQTEANPDRQEDTVVFTAEEWAAVEDHVSTVQAIYGNPDRHTPAYTADQQDGPLPPAEDEVQEMTVSDQVRLRMAGAASATMTRPHTGGGGAGGYSFTVIGAGAGTKDGPGEPGRITITPVDRAARNTAAPQGQCWARHEQDGFCWLPEGHAPIGYGTKDDDGEVYQQVAGHITAGGRLFWAGV